MNRISDYVDNPSSSSFKPNFDLVSPEEIQYFSDSLLEEFDELNRKSCIHGISLPQKVIEWRNWIEEIQPQLNNFCEPSHPLYIRGLLALKMVNCGILKTISFVRCETKSIATLSSLKIFRFYSWRRWMGTCWKWVFHMRFRVKARVCANRFCVFCLAVRVEKFCLSLATFSPNPETHKTQNHMISDIRQSSTMVKSKLNYWSYPCQLNESYSEKQWELK